MKYLIFTILIKHIKSLNYAKKMCVPDHIAHENHL
jgi:hypothetical protein